MFVGDDAIRLLHESSLRALFWRELAVDGAYFTAFYAPAALPVPHPPRQCFSHTPGATTLDATIVFGVNHAGVSEPSTVSFPPPPAPPTALFRSLSCRDAYGIESGTVTTIHSSMNDQQVIDSWHPDLRRDASGQPINHPGWILSLLRRSVVFSSV